MKALRLLNQILLKIEVGTAISALLFMIGLAFLQVILRNVFQFGIIWAEQVIQVMVLWVGFLGASIATQSKGHIRMDLLSKFLPGERSKEALEFILSVFSSFVCYLLAKTAFAFVVSEKEFGSSFADLLPTWVVLSVIPISFILMSFRFALLALEDLIVLSHPVKKVATS